MRFFVKHSWVILFALLCLVAASALLVGAADINFHDDNSILMNIRLPRVLLALLVGSGLAVAGLVMQNMLHNPLAEPGLIGVSAGAAFAVALFIVLLDASHGVLALYGMSIAAFLGALISCLVIFRLSKTQGVISVSLMLLAGIAINALANAGTGLMSYLSTDEQLRNIIFWTLGSLGGALWSNVIVAASILLPCMAVMLRVGSMLNVLSLGEKEAGYLGVNVEYLKRYMVYCVALMVGTCVALTGIIGFVGLVVPHCMRLLFGADNRVTLPASMLGGAILLIIADMAARTLVAPAELPIGILTALMGGPFFLWLLVQRFVMSR